MIRFSLLPLLRLVLFTLVIGNSLAIAASFDMLTKAELVIHLPTEQELAMYQMFPPPPEQMEQLTSPHVEVRLDGLPTCYSIDWQSKQVNAQIIHLRQRDWLQPFLEFDLVHETIALISNGHFGKTGDGVKNTSGLTYVGKNDQGDYVISLEPVILSCDTSRKKIAVSLAFHTLPLTDGSQFKAEHMDDRLLMIRHLKWKQHYWKINSDKGLAWRVSNISEADQKQIADARVLYIADAAPKSDEPTVSARSQTSYVPNDKAMLADKHPGRESSPWQERQKVLYHDLLGSIRYDALLIPAQVDGFAVDRAGRSLITRFLHQRLRQLGWSLPDPTLTARALGERSRTYSPKDIAALAGRIGATTVIIPAVGHDGNGRLSLNLLRQQVDHHGIPLADKTVLASCNNLPFSDTRLPFEVFVSHMDELLKSIGCTPTATAQASIRDNEPLLPQQPCELFTQNKPSLVQQAFTLQLLGMLHPRENPTQEGLFERSLVLAWQLPVNHPQRNLLIARALFRLNRRPAALKYLEQAKTVEEHALLAFLNGNLPNLQENRSRIATPLKWLLANIDYADLLWTYTQRPLPDATIAEIVGNQVEWETLIVRRLQRNWMWSNQSNLVVKQMLDEAFPLADFTVGELMGNRLLLHQSPFEGGEIDRSVYEHYRRMVSNSGASLFPDTHPLAPRKGDYLDLLAATGEANLFDAVYKSVVLQHRMDAGLEQLRQSAGVYEGHPDLTYLKSEALERKAQSSLGSEAARLNAEVAHLKDLAGYWSQEQNTYSRLKIFDQDFPKRFYWTTASDKLASLENSLEYTNSRADIAASLYDSYQRYRAGKTIKRQKLLAELEQRFIGAPQRQYLLAEISERQGNVDKAQQYYRTCIKLYPEQWEAYQKQAELLIRHDLIDEAYQTLMAIPDFNRPSPLVNAVGFSNFANRMGSMFRKLGEPGKALTFFRYCQTLGTGSGAEMVSAAQEAMINNDYATMAQHCVRLIRRYQSLPGYHAYINYQHLTGQHTTAWSVFNNLSSRQYLSSIWQAALFGFRMEGTSEQDQDRWFADRVNRPESSSFVLYRLMDRSQFPAINTLPRSGGQNRKQFLALYRGYKTRSFTDSPYSHQFQQGQGITSKLLPWLAFYYEDAGRGEEFQQRLNEYLAVHGSGFDSLLAQGIIAGLQDDSHTALTLFHKACLRYAELQQQQTPFAGWPFAMEAKYTTNPEKRMTALGAALYLDRNSVRIAHFSRAEKQRATEQFDANKFFAPRQSDAQTQSPPKQI
ncbi:hypothetical protein HTZ97_11470 [Desulfuromonas acetoxidans]|uniref:Tetratricopeptide TPR_2 n=1 Tax=Desulfuromonas acetoxidans (strain DSM 684 / 11070) TaxID=281689 RepID=Q1JWX0_DESA6|nr:tetratricopeptide repeat protein [Desulfuromonas acetoxidans]EAT14788.1 Tetratricopeptide TPR_2 [Desulfuromonas acetoxidans DSM 684]MBF0645861.1 hypothetical protein [Desulfuromonas acetoxidans]NVD25041.1 hypothetical protein [Desulfuromonas acetoxidans]NVE17086.1 hypothetical protein [Desulfuromonas acetoxidans]